MDLKDSPEEQAFRLELRGWLEHNAPAPPPEGFEAARAWHRTLHAAGYAGLSWPTEYGGRGGTAAQQVIFEEELGRLGLPGLSNQLGIFNVGPAIMTHGTPGQKQRYLPKILSAEEIWCQGYSEPGAGSDLASLRTKAVLDGDDFVVSGQKVWTTWGHHADWCQLLVRSEPEEPKHKGISCLLVDMHSPGVQVRPLRQISGGAEFNELFFDDVRVPAANLLGARGEGWGVAMATLANERAGVLTMHVRTSRQLRELAALARERDKGADPLFRQRLGQCAIDARVLQLFSYWATSNARGFEGPLAKLLWSELQQHIYELAFDVLGADAVADGDWLRGLLDSRGMTIAAGTTEIQKNVLAERALGLPR
jgi:alkylation response protein AidB-like acyl-CoA dehydrogenase